MAKIPPPPLAEPIVGEDGQLSTAWALYFDQQHRGDRGSDWVPVFVGLTTIGGVNITGRYYRISERIAYFSVTIVPTSGSTTATAGGTYITNFPLSVLRNGACHAVSGLLGTSAGMIDAASNRIYVPGWSAVTVPLTITGICEVM